jgi:hypothetical protein
MSETRSKVDRSTGTASLMALRDDACAAASGPLDFHAPRGGSNAVPIIAPLQFTSLASRSQRNGGDLVTRHIDLH